MKKQVFRHESSCTEASNSVVKVHLNDHLLVKKIFWLTSARHKGKRDEGRKREGMGREGRQGSDPPRLEPSIQKLLRKAMK
jgi:hypothetical protein